MSDLYTKLLKAKAGGHKREIMFVGREVKGTRTRLLGRQGGPYCQHVSDVRGGTMVHVPVDEALTWLRKKAHETMTKEEVQVFKEMLAEQEANAIREPVAGQVLMGVQAMGHMLIMAHLDRENM